MEIAIIYNKNNNVSLKKTEGLKRKLASNNTNIDMISIPDNMSSITNKYDVYVLIIENMYDLLICKTKIENHSKILIITENTNVTFVLACINVTKNLLYFNVEYEIVYQKINVIFSENYNKIKKIENKCK